jgi:uncharacterized protein (TIGR00251 family)
MATEPPPADCLRSSGDDLLLRIRVQPRASRAGLDAIDAGVLRLRVTAPPADGSANRAVVELLAATLGLARGRVTIARGESARHKLVRIAGAAAEVLRIRSMLVAALDQSA